MDNLLSLKDLAGGALQEKADDAMRRVLQNMQDPNTPWKNKRAITIKVAFAQNENRDDMEVEISVDAKLAPVSPVTTRMAVGKDLKSNSVIAQEYGRQIHGQMSITDYENSHQDGEAVDTETGEILEQENKVIDLRRAAL